MDFDSIEELTTEQIEELYDSVLENTSDVVASCYCNSVENGGYCFVYRQTTGYCSGICCFNSATGSPSTGNIYIRSGGGAVACSNASQRSWNPDYRYCPSF